MAPMKPDTLDCPDLETLILAIRRSPIVVEDRALAHLPAGFDKVDLAILRWIAADSHHASPIQRPN